VKCLLDISTLLAAIWQNHSAHKMADRWVTGKSLAVCPFSELGFLRISTHPKGPFRANMADARALLDDFLKKNNCHFISADLPGLHSNATDSETVTDSYLADLAEKHGMKLATLDTRIHHRAAELVV